MASSSISYQDNYAPDTVIVMLTHDASLDFKARTINDFPELNLISVECLTPGVELVKQKLLGRSYDPKWTVNLETFRRVYKLTLENPSKENVLSAIEKLKSRDDVECAMPDLIITREPFKQNTRTRIMNDDPLYQWHLETSRIREAWEITTGSPNVRIGVMDTGIDTTHEDLIGRVDLELGWSYFDDILPNADTSFHGTHVAGIIGANGNNGIGVAGVCWHSRMVDLIVFRINRGFISAYMAAIKHATDLSEQHRIHILNFSVDDSSGLNTLEYVPIWEAIVSQFPGLLVVSAGNLGSNNDNNRNYPARLSRTHDNVITVGASNPQNNRITHMYRWWSSNFGRNTVDLFSPGQDVMSTIPYGYQGLDGYAELDGTSMAAPIVTGAAALMLSVNPDLTAAQLKELLRLSVNTADVGYHIARQSVTGGMLDVYTAVRLARGDIIQIEAPTNISIEETEEHGMLRWSAVNHTTGYHIYVNGVRRTTSPLPIIQNSFDLRTLGNLFTFGSYNIQVRAVNSSELFIDSDLSDPIAFRVEMRLQTPSISLISFDTVYIALNQVPHATGYHVYINGIRRTTTPITHSFNMHTLEPALELGNHIVQIRAINPSEYVLDSALSVGATFRMTKTLDAPTISVDENGLVTWAPIAESEGYHVYVGNVRRTTTAIIETEFDLEPLNLGLGWNNIQVRAINSSEFINNSALSNGVTFIVSITLEKPTNVSLMDNVLGWNEVVNAGGYHVYINGVRKTITPIVETTINLATFSLGFGVHNIQVRAVNNSQFVFDSELSEVVKHIISTTLSAPVISISDSIVTWEQITHATNYHIYVNGTRRITAMITGTTFNLSTLFLGFGEHKIQVRAVNPIATVTDSELSNVAVFRRKTTLAKPIEVYMEEDGVVSWDSVPNATGFHIYVNGIYKATTTTASFDLNTLTPQLAHGSHSVQIRAIHPAGYFINSDLSTPIIFEVYNPDPTPTEPDDDENDFPWIWVAVGGGTFLLLCVGTAFILIRKRKKKAA